MQLMMLKAKLHQARVTQVDPDYEGSVTIDVALMEAAGILPHERVEIYDITNGARFATYAIEGERGSGVIGVNGAAAHLVNTRDKIIICAYAYMSTFEAKRHVPKVVLLDAKNKVKANALQQEMA